MKTDGQSLTYKDVANEETRRRLPLLCTDDERDIIERAVCLFRAWRGDVGRRDPATDGEALAAMCRDYLDRQKGSGIAAKFQPGDLAS